LVISGQNYSLENSRKFQSKNMKNMKKIAHEGYFFILFFTKI
jgi:hypothetical protein